MVERRARTMESKNFWFRILIFIPLKIQEISLRLSIFNKQKRHARKKTVKLWKDYNWDATSERVWSHCGLINKTKYSYRLDGQKWTSIASCKYSNFNARAITWNNLKFNMHLVCLTFHSWIDSFLESHRHWYLLQLQFRNFVFSKLFEK